MLAGGARGNGEELVKGENLDGACSQLARISNTGRDRGPYSGFAALPAYLTAQRQLKVKDRENRNKLATHLFGLREIWGLQDDSCNPLQGQ